MPLAPLPDELSRFLTAPRPAVVASVRPDGAPITAATWYLWEDGRVILSMEADGLRARNLRGNPAIALTVLADDWYSQLSLVGRVVELRPDPELAELDRLALHYAGAPYPERDLDPVTAFVEIDRWSSFGSPGTP